MFTIFPDAEKSDVPFPKTRRSWTASALPVGGLKVMDERHG